MLFGMVDQCRGSAYSGHVLEQLQTRTAVTPPTVTHPGGSYLDSVVDAARQCADHSKQRGLATPLALLPKQPAAALPDSVSHSLIASLGPRSSFGCAEGTAALGGGGGGGRNREAGDREARGRCCCHPTAAATTATTAALMKGDLLFLSIQVQHLPLGDNNRAEGSSKRAQALQK